MAEYIEREALLSELQEEIDFETSMYTEEQNKYFNMGLKCAVRDVKSQPTADVVPKSEVDEIVRQWKEEANCWQNNYITELRANEQIKAEVAREIFGEFEEEINAALKNNYARRGECNAETDLSHAANISGKIACLRGLADFVEELKKKYIGEIE